MAYEICENEYFGQNPEIVNLVRQMCLFDDDFMSKVFSEPKLAEFLIQVLLGRKDLTVIQAIPQFEIKNIYGRSVKLDIYAKDSEGNILDIEVQRKNSGAVPRRARYNNCLMDSNSILKGVDFAELPEAYIIFITENDYFKKGQPLYKIERFVDGTELFNDGTHIIYVNGKNRSDTELGRLMADFAQTDPNKFHNDILAEAVHRYKYSEEVDDMCQLIEDYAERYAEKIADNRAEVRANEKRKAIALSMIAKGKLSFEEIAEYTDFTLEEIKALAENQSA